MSFKLFSNFFITKTYLYKLSIINKNDMVGIDGDTVEYRFWQTLKKNCYDVNHKNYKHWGNIGITICDEWRQKSKGYLLYVRSLDNFDLPNKRLVRIDPNNKCFEPGNVMWIDPKTLKLKHIKKELEIVQPKKKGNYITDTELRYEIILSKGRGILSKKAEHMLILLGERFIRTKHYYNNDYREDCFQSGMEGLFRNWRNFNEYKYDKTFPFYTEIFKRSIAFGFNELVKDKDQTLSLDYWYDREGQNNY